MGELYRLDFPNGKSYIGITEKTSSNRFKGHAASAKHGAKTLIHNAWRKHGEPKLVLLAVVENSDLLETEKRAIKIFGTLAPNGYNSTEGGDFNPSKLDWINKKRADASRGRPLTEKQKKQIEMLAELNRGRPFSEDHLQKLSKAGKGKPKSEEHKRNISLASKGKKMSQEAIEKTRAKLIGRKNPAQAERMKGNTHWMKRKDQQS